VKHAVPSPHRRRLERCLSFRGRSDRQADLPVLHTRKRRRDDRRKRALQPLLRSTGHARGHAAVDRRSSREPALGTPRPVADRPCCLAADGHPERGRPPLLASRELPIQPRAGHAHRPVMGSLTRAVIPISLRPPVGGGSRVSSPTLGTHLGLRSSVKQTKTPL
jgi:hypothetical protein